MSPEQYKLANGKYQISRRVPFGPAHRMQGITQFV
jgi:hypothetical protein